MLTVDVAGARGRPELRLEAATGGRIVLRQNERVVLYGRLHPWWYYFDFLRLPGYVAPIPPIRAAHARRLGGDLERWAHHFLDQLRAGGHLYEARWSLTSPAGHLLLRPWRELVVDSSGGNIDLFIQNGGGMVVALRPLSAPDAGRVKSYAKQAQDGILAPVLLWWVSPMDCYVVLDGHDRLAACLAHDIEPPVLVLDTVPEAATDDVVGSLSADYAKTVELIEAEIARGSSGAEAALERIHRGFGARLAAGTARSRTRAWAFAGGVDEWRRQVSLVDQEWLAEVDPDASL